MSRGTRLPLYRALGVILLALVWLAMLLFGTETADRRVLELLYAGGKPALVTACEAFTFLGQPPVLIALGLLAAAWLWWRHWPGYALTVVAVTLFGRALAELQKYLIDRPRPVELAHLVHEHTPSFPSGHATSSMIVYLTLAVVLIPRRWRRTAITAAVLLSLLIGLSRVMLGVHWPSDVVAGWSFGALWVLLTLPLAQRSGKRYSRELRWGGADGQ